MARTQIRVCRNHRTKAGTKGDKSKPDHKRDGEKRESSHPKGSSDVQEPKMAGSSGFRGGDQLIK